jgi:hypothetical protein
MKTKPLVCLLAVALALVPSSSDAGAGEGTAASRDPLGPGRPAPAPQAGPYHVVEPKLIYPDLSYLVFTVTEYGVIIPHPKRAHIPPPQARIAFGAQAPGTGQLSGGYYFGLSGWNNPVTIQGAVDGRYNTADFSGPNKIVFDGYASTPHYIVPHRVLHFEGNVVISPAGTWLQGTLTFLPAAPATTYFTEGWAAYQPPFF